MVEEKPDFEGGVEDEPRRGGEVDPGPSRDVIVPTRFRPTPTASGKVVRFRARPAILATWLLGATLLVLAWFSFAAVSIQLGFDPAPDRVSLPESVLKLHLGDRHLLRPGLHKIVAEKEGYYPLAAVIRVGDEADQHFSFTLTKLPGLVRVDTLPAAGASVSVDGMPMGTTPLEPLELAAGRRRISIDAPRHLPVERVIDVEGRGIEQTVRVELVPAWAPITIDSIPSAAALLVDGVELGATPGTFELDAGTRRLELRVQGYKAWSKELVVKADEPQILDPIELVPVDGRLRIETVPAGARVVVGKVSSGQTPLDLELASGEAHEISLFKPGYEIASRSVEIDAGEEKLLKISLTPQLGIVELVTHPPDATLSVDGRQSGSATQTLRLIATAHTLIIRKPGYADRTLSVTPLPGFPQRLEVRLDELSRPQPAAKPRQIESPIGQKLVLVDPGRFDMGSRPGEPGRRSNETPRPVQITRPFYFGITEVTNREFREFSPDHVPAPHQGFALDQDDQPVVRVTWEQAVRFCNWLSLRGSLRPSYVERGGKWTFSSTVPEGYRLPTEAEWSWAARYSGGKTDTPFPWGNEPEPAAGNYADASAAGVVPSALLSYRDGFPVSAPVGSFAGSPLGLFDVGGNVAEWIHDRYTIYPPPRTEAPVEDPIGPEYGSLQVIRGSSWKHSTTTELRLAYRDYGENAREDVGFRIARFAN